MEFLLRGYRMEDVASLAKHANNSKIAANLRDGFPFPYTEEAGKSFIEAALNTDPSVADFRAVVVGGEAVGGIGLSFGVDVHRLSAELGYWLGEAYWGQGVITGAVRQICADAFAKTGLNRIYATPYGHNTASCRVLEKAGFVLEGTMRNYAIKNGVIVDGFLYALIKK